MFGKRSERKARGIFGTAMDHSASKNPMGLFGLQSEMGNDSDDRGKRVMEELDADDMQANWTPGRKEAEAWFFADIQSLIDFRRELDAQFTTAKSNKELWRKISAKMRERGFNWSSSLCAQRWGDLLTDYYDMKRQMFYLTISCLAVIC